VSGASRVERPTLHDLARATGISKSTVSRALNQHPNVSPQTRRTVLAAAERLNYQANHAARALRTRMTNTVGLVVGSLRNEVWAAVAQGMDQALSATGRTLLVATAGNEREHEIAVTRALLRRNVDGLVVGLTDERSPVLAALERHGLPTVVIDRDVRRSFADALLTDHEPGLTAALADLEANGHRRIGMLCAPVSVRPGREVASIFSRVCPQSADLVLGGPLNEEFGGHGAADLLSRPSPPTALVAAGTQLLVGALLEIGRRGLTVPRDLSLITYDECAAARVHRPAISVIDRNRELIGETAARLILDRIDGRRSRRTEVTLPSSYVKRGSVACVPHPGARERARRRGPARERGR